jgi:triacylglycerol lipase
MSQAQLHTRNHSARIGARRRRDGMGSLGAVAGARTLLRTVGRAALVQTYEVGLMASLAVTAPLHLVGERYNAAVGAPIHRRTLPTARPVLLVHGFGGTKSSWSFLARALTAGGLTVHAITYSPFGTSVERLADRLAVAVESLLSQTGADKVHLVGHSLGGVVIAQAVASGRLTGRVDTVVTLASPFGGSPWASLLPFGAIVSALRQGSPLLRRLAASQVQEGIRWMAFTATLDAIVPGGRSIPAQIVKVGGVGHLGMLLSPEVVRRIVAAFSADG